MEPKRTLRRRCCECRDWYAPEPSASLTQMTCSVKCRLRRRAKRERKRRAENPSAAREGERERQRHHRERVSAGESPQMSLTGLSGQAAEAIDEIIEKLGQTQRLSRAGLRRQLRRLSLGEPKSAGRKTGT